MNIKRFLQTIFLNNIVWHLFKPFIYLANRLSSSRKNFVNRKEEDECVAICNTIFADGKILHGLFKGLNMHNIKPTGSNQFSKLLGRYEEAIMRELAILLKKNYVNFINIGSDEGYYAVGISSLYPQINIYAFDCNKDAQKRCLRLAKANDITNKLSINGCFSEEKISEIDPLEKSLFLVDCEGCENEIITSELIAKHFNSDFIIELHYETHPNLLSKLTAIFNKSHRIRLITALSDHEIIMNNNDEELKTLAYFQKKYILSERDYYTQWFIAESFTD